MLIDIAFNATDKAYKDNIDLVMNESRASSVMPLLVGTDMHSSVKAAEVARKYKTFSFFGLHPLSDIPPSDSWIGDLESGIKENTDVVIAVGECGLDYFRSSKCALQIKVFEKQLEIAKKYDLPVFTHCRKAFDDVYRRIDGIRSGVIHSFDGTLEEAEKFIKKGMFIGLNGCSLRSEESIGVVENLPLDKMLIETDSPYCLIRKSYAAARYISLIKARSNMPYYLRNVLEAISAIKEISPADLEEQITNNALSLFPEIQKTMTHWDDKYAETSQ